MIKSFNITDRDSIDKLSQVRNQSKYIELLIMKDIADNKDKDQFVAGMRKTVEYIQKSLDIINDTINNDSHK